MRLFAKPFFNAAHYAAEGGLCYGVEDLSSFFVRFEQAAIFHLAEMLGGDVALEIARCCELTNRKLFNKEELHHL